MVLNLGTHIALVSKAVKLFLAVNRMGGVHFGRLQSHTFLMLIIGQLRFNYIVRGVFFHFETH